MARTQHYLSLHVPFPGIGNDLKLRLPMSITSGIDAPMSLDQPDGTHADGDAPPPAPLLDLPPYVIDSLDRCRRSSDFRQCRSYWDVNDRDWGNLDEKE